MPHDYQRIMQAAARSLDQGKRTSWCSDGGSRSALMEAEYADWCHSYGEPGYDDPPNGIIFANWNHFPAETTYLLEKAGYAIEWSDEWIISHEVRHAYRCSPDSYSWTCYYVQNDDGNIIGGDEIESGDMLDWYIDEYLLNNPTRANVFKIDLEAAGFKRFNGNYETGLHPGQNDKPKTVLAAIRATMPNHDVVFSIDSVGQFDTCWSAWVRPSAE